jgi:hypothetical protein
MTQNSASLQRTMLAVGTIVLIGVFIYVYRNDVYPLHSYVGLRDCYPGIEVLGIHAILAFLPCLWLPLVIRQPSDFVYILLYVICYFPTVLTPVLSLEQGPADFIPFSIYACIAFFLLKYAASMKLYSFTLGGAGGASFWIVLTAIWMLSNVYIMVVFGTNFSLVAIEDVYQKRDEFAKLTDSVPALAYYVIGWQAGAIDPMCIAYGLKRRNVGWIALGVAGELVIYSTTAFKTSLFTPLAQAGFFFLLQRRETRDRFAPAFIWLVTLLVPMFGVLDRLLDTIFFEALVLHRCFTCPGFLAGCYFDFFSSHPYVFFSDNIMRRFIEYPYHQAVPNVISSTYTAFQDGFANANFFAHGYSQAGAFGILGMTLVLGVILSVCNELSRRKNVTTVCCLLVPSIMSLSNSGVTITLLTNGMAMALLLIPLLPDTEDLPVRRLPATLKSAPRRTLQEPSLPV